jgi:enoyl-[acyl-carrier protein] reductase / trans-2-enoyl-CoA reductase (NAD+)
VAESIVKLKKKGFISLNAHPLGCAANVADAVERARSVRATTRGDDGCCIVLGSSTGYGLASTITSAFAHGMPTIGVCLERAPERGRTGTAGWYNTAAVHDHARQAGVPVRIVNADCFAHDTKRQVLDLAREHGPVRLLINSVASPVRTDPDTGELLRSVLKPVGDPYSNKTIRLDSGEVTQVELEPATDVEVEQTRRVMGGEDWSLWLAALAESGLMADDFRTVAYTYIGPELTHPIYRSGSIGQAKAHLEATARHHAAELAAGGSGRGAWTSVNGAAVTQSSTAIPAVPLYLSILMAVTRDQGLPFLSVGEQIHDLFARLFSPDVPVHTDDQDRIRLDDWEMEASIQAEIERRWAAVTSDNLAGLADFTRFEHEFDRLFGFGVDGIDYDAPVEVDVPFEGTSRSGSDPTR